MLCVVHMTLGLKSFLNSLNPIRLLRTWRVKIFAWRRFWESYRQYDKLLPEGKSLSNEKLYPCIGDDTSLTSIEPTYFYQDSWAFEHLVNRAPSTHIDVGSHHTFVAFLSKVMPVTMVDIRPLSLDLSSIKFKKGSILSLPFIDQSLFSVSSLCVVEHIGLGRYGDFLDPLGTEKSIKELRRVLAPQGYLYISLPVDDKNTIYFNAHRSFSEEYIITLFDGFTIIDRKYIYGNRFVNTLESGFGIACYVLKKVINSY